MELMTAEEDPEVVDGHMLSSNSCKGSEDSGLYEKFLLDDLDSYWDDIQDRLTVSRMVSESVIKGMVNAVTEEAADRIASKEVEIAVLNQRLLSCSNLGIESVKSELTRSDLDASVGGSYKEHLSRLKVMLMDHLESVKSKDTSAETDGRVDDLKVVVDAAFDQISSMFCSMRASAVDCQFEHDIQREVTAIAFQNSIRSLHGEFEAKLYEQRRIINSLDVSWQKKVAELSTLREELDTISRSLVSELGPLTSHNSFEIFEEHNTAKGRDHFSRHVFGNHHASCISHPEGNGTNLAEKSADSPKPMIEVADSTHLKHLTKDEVVTYYNNEVMKMRRQHDQALLEKTEEVFKLKREFLKEKGSSHFRKDKEIETLRRRIPEVISKLDEILLENEKLPMFHDAHDELSSLKDRIDSLLVENQHVRSLLIERRKEVKSLSSQVSGAAEQISLRSSAEANFLKQMSKLQGDTEDVKIEANIRSIIYHSILKELIGEHKCGTGEALIETDIVQNIHCVVFGGALYDAISTIKFIISKYHMEKDSLEANLFEKERVLLLEMEENKKLKQDIMSLSTLMKEMDTIASNADSSLVQHKEHFDMVNREIGMLREQVEKQEGLISDKDTSLSMLRKLVEKQERLISDKDTSLSMLGKLVDKQERVISDNDSELGSLREQVDKQEMVISDKDIELGSLREQADKQDIAIYENDKKISVLREQVDRQESLISDKDTELVSMNGRLNETLRQVHQCEMEIDVLNRRFKIASDSLEEADQENTMLRFIVEDKQTRLSASISKESKQANHMKCIIASMMELSRAIADLEKGLVENLHKIGSRLEKLSHQCSLLAQQFILLEGKELWYQQIVEIKSSNLKKAEDEVDLLGDEVDALLSLLGKIYVALDHYSPVFELYPGVMDILKLVQRELKGDTIRLA